MKRNILIIIGLILVAISGTAKADDHDASLTYEVRLCWSNTQVKDIERYFGGVGVRYEKLPADTKFTPCSKRYDKLTDRLFWIKVIDRRHLGDSATSKSDEDVDSDDEYDDEESDSNNGDEKITGYPFGALVNLVRSCNNDDSKCPYKGKMREQWEMLGPNYTDMLQMGNSQAKRFGKSKKMSHRLEKLLDKNKDGEEDEED